MNQPKQPTDPPAEGTSVVHDPTGSAPNGIPHGEQDAEATGHPTSDREQTETAASPAKD